MITLILTLALVGFLVYLVVTFIPMPEPFKKIIIALVVVLLIIYLVQMFNLDVPLPNRR